jgi:NAD(P)-dependent dehydrogenase (short-subunit alcohol dehydrogenase family)
MADGTGRLAGRVAVVTGGGNGLGRATALRFAEEGAAVVVADLLDGPAEETVRLIEAAGGRATPVSVDVTSRVDNDAMARTASAATTG